MPISDTTEAMSTTSPATATSGWDASGEYVERKKKEHADEAACAALKARWQGVKGLDGGLLSGAVTSV